MILSKLLPVVSYEYLLQGADYMPLSRHKEGQEIHARALIAASPDTILVSDTIGTITMCSGGAADLLGYKVEEIIGQNLISLIFPAKVLRKSEVLQGNRVSETMGNGTTENVIGVRKDKTEFAMSLVVRKWIIDDKEFFVTAVRDITAEKSLKAEVLECRARLGSILDTSPQAIIVIDEMGVIEMFSPAASRLFGYTSDEVIGQNVKLLMPPPYRDQHNGHLLNYRRTGEKRIFGKGRIMVAQRRDGTTFPMEIYVGEVQAGDKRQFTGFVRDVTERPHRLQELQGELLHVSRVSVMGQMTAAIAHELNQPLTAIANYIMAASRVLTSATEDTEGPVLARELMDKAVKQTLRAGVIVKSLGDFVKKRVSNRMPENLNKVVEEAIALGFVGAADSNVKLRVHLDPALRRVVIDRIQIQQVVINLIRNSIEAMECVDQARIRELTVVTCERDGCAVVTISDTGPGLPENVSKSLFQPLITTKNRGMGMGLAICRSIMEAHEGRIWVLPGKLGGTTFCIRLPPVDAKAAA